jgi:sterol desaturase/sphingolipid hydroxylase (fatty acid hydroxylase superfamily)
VDLVPYAVPFFLLAIVLELGYGVWKGRNTYRLNDATGSLFMGSLRTVNQLVLIGVGGLVFAAIEQRYSLWRMDTSSVLTWVFAWVAYDFCYYWNHRIGHERQIFWASHVAHHQSEDYNLSTALRQTSTGFLLGWIFYVPLFLLGLPAYVYVTVASLNLIYQFWVHTEHVPKLGWLEWVLITPSNHRVHHAQNDRYLDRNYGGFFIIWDRLFGTFQEELDEEPCIYGIRGPLLTFNPLWANLHIYAGMLQDAWRTASWKDTAWMLFSRTGWRPADVAERYPRPKTDLDHFNKFDPVAVAGAGAYALFHLVVAVAVLLVVTQSLSLSYLHNAAVVAMLTFTMVCTTQWLDAKPAAVKLDGLRLLLFPLFVALVAAQGYDGQWLLALALYWLVNLGFFVVLRRATQASETHPRAADGGESAVPGTAIPGQNPLR